MSRRKRAFGRGSGNHPPDNGGRGPAAPTPANTPDGSRSSDDEHLDGEEHEVANTHAGGVRHSLRQQQRREQLRRQNEQLQQEDHHQQQREQQHHHQHHPWWDGQHYSGASGTGSNVGLAGAAARNSRQHALTHNHGRELDRQQDFGMRDEGQQQQERRFSGQLPHDYGVSSPPPPPLKRRWQQDQQLQRQQQQQPQEARQRLHELPLQQLRQQQQAAVPALHQRGGTQAAQQHARAKAGDAEEEDSDEDWTTGDDEGAGGRRKRRRVALHAVSHHRRRSQAGQGHGEARVRGGVQQRTQHQQQHQQQASKGDQDTHAMGQVQPTHSAFAATPSPPASRGPLVGTFTPWDRGAASLTLHAAVAAPAGAAAAAAAGGISTANPRGSGAAASGARTSAPFSPTSRVRDTTLFPWLRQESPMQQPQQQQQPRQQRQAQERQQQRGPGAQQPRPPEQKQQQQHVEQQRQEKPPSGQLPWDGGFPAPQRKEREREAAAAAAGAAPATSPFAGAGAAVVSSPSGSMVDLSLVRRMYGFVPGSPTSSPRPGARSLPRSLSMALSYSMPPPPPPPTMPPPRQQPPGGPSPLRPVPSLLQALPAVQQQLQIQSQQQQEQQRFDETTPPLSPSLFLAPLLASPAPGGAGVGGTGGGGGFAVPGAAPSLGARALSQLLRSAVWAPDWGASGAEQPQPQPQQAETGRQQSPFQGAHQDQPESSALRCQDPSAEGPQASHSVPQNQARSADVSSPARVGELPGTGGARLGPGGGGGQWEAMGGYRPADVGPSAAAGVAASAADTDRRTDGRYEGGGKLLPREPNPAALASASPQHREDGGTRGTGQQQGLQLEPEGQPVQQGQTGGSGTQPQRNGAAGGGGGGQRGAAGQRSDADELLDAIYASPFSPGMVQQLLSSSRGGPLNRPDGPRPPPPGPPSAPPPGPPSAPPPGPPPVPQFAAPDQPPVTPATQAPSPLLPPPPLAAASDAAAAATSAGVTAAATPAGVTAAAEPVTPLVPPPFPVADAGGGGGNAGGGGGNAGGAREGVGQALPPQWQSAMLPFLLPSTVSLWGALDAAGGGANQEVDTQQQVSPNGDAADIRGGGVGVGADGTGVGVAAAAPFGAVWHSYDASLGSIRMVASERGLLVSPRQPPPPPLQQQQQRQQRLRAATGPGGSVRDMRAEGTDGDGGSSATETSSDWTAMGGAAQGASAGAWGTAAASGARGGAANGGDSGGGHIDDAAERLLATDETLAWDDGPVPSVAAGYGAASFAAAANPYGAFQPLPPPPAPLGLSYGASYLLSPGSAGTGGAVRSSLPTTAAAAIGGNQIQGPAGGGSGGGRGVLGAWPSGTASHNHSLIHGFFSPATSTAVAAPGGRPARHIVTPAATPATKGPGTAADLTARQLFISPPQPQQQRQQQPPNPYSQLSPPLPPLMGTALDPLRRATASNGTPGSGPFPPWQQVQQPLPPPHPLMPAPGAFGHLLPLLPPLPPLPPIQPLSTQPAHMTQPGAPGNTGGYPSPALDASTPDAEAGASAPCAAAAVASGPTPIPSGLPLPSAPVSYDSLSWAGLINPLGAVPAAGAFGAGEVGAPGLASMPNDPGTTQTGAATPSPYGLPGGLAAIPGLPFVVPRQPQGEGRAGQPGLVGSSGTGAEGLQGQPQDMGAVQAAPYQAYQTGNGLRHNHHAHLQQQQHGAAVGYIGVEQAEPRELSSAASEARGQQPRGPFTLGGMTVLGGGGRPMLPIPVQMLLKQEQHWQQPQQPPSVGASPAVPAVRRMGQRAGAVSDDDNAEAARTLLLMSPASASAPTASGTPRHATPARPGPSRAGSEPPVAHRTPAAAPASTPQPPVRGSASRPPRPHPPHASPPGSVGPGRKGAASSAGAATAGTSSSAAHPTTSGGGGGGGGGGYSSGFTKPSKAYAGVPLVPPVPAPQPPIRPTPVTRARPGVYYPWRHLPHLPFFPEPSRRRQRPAPAAASAVPPQQQQQQQQQRQQGAKGTATVGAAGGFGAVKAASDATGRWHAVTTGGGGGAGGMPGLTGPAAAGAINLTALTGGSAQSQGGGPPAAAAAANMTSQQQQQLAASLQSLQLLLLMDRAARGFAAAAAAAQQQQQQQQPGGGALPSLPSMPLRQTGVPTVGPDQAASTPAAAATPSQAAGSGSGDGAWDTAAQAAGAPSGGAGGGTRPVSWGPGIGGAAGGALELGAGGRGAAAAAATKAPMPGNPQVATPAIALPSAQDDSGPQKQLQLQQQQQEMWDTTGPGTYTYEGAGTAGDNGAAGDGHLGMSSNAAAYWHDGAVPAAGPQGVGHVAVAPTTAGGNGGAGSRPPLPPGMLPPQLQAPQMPAWPGHGGWAGVQSGAMEAGDARLQAQGPAGDQGYVGQGQEEEQGQGQGQQGYAAQAGHLLSLGPYGGTGGAAGPTGLDPVMYEPVRMGPDIGALHGEATGGQSSGQQLPRQADPALYRGPCPSPGEDVAGQGRGSSGLGNEQGMFPGEAAAAAAAAAVQGGGGGQPAALSATLGSAVGFGAGLLGRGRATWQAPT